MPINLTDASTFNTAVLVGDSGPGGSTPTLTVVGGLTIAAALEVQSTLGAFVLPRMSDPFMEALFPVVDGMMIYNTTNTSIYAHQNGSWGPITGGGGGSVTSITQGANIVLTPSPIVATGSVALNPVLTGLTSAVIGNISISTTANTISGSGILTVSAAGGQNLTLTGQIINLNPTTGVLIKNGNDLFFENSTNTNSISIGVGSIVTDSQYTLPLILPTVNGQMLTSTTAGIMSWVTPGTGTVTSITAGSNLTGGVITGSGTIGLSNSVSGLTSLAVGNFTISGTTIASTTSMTLSPLAALNINSGSTAFNSDTTIKTGHLLKFNNPADTFFTSISAGTQLSNLNYTLPITAPTNGQVLSTTSGGVMSWITAGSGSVTSITQGSNIICTPNPITGAGTIALDPNPTSLSSLGIGTLSLTANTITASVGVLTITSAGSLNLTSGGFINCDGQVDIRGNHGLNLLNSSNTFGTELTSGNVTANTIYVLPPAYPTIDGQILSCTAAGTMTWITGNGGAPNTSTYILNHADASLPNGQSMALLGTGLVKNTSGTGIFSIGTPGIDYYANGAPTRILDSGTNFFIGTSAGTATVVGTHNTGVGIGALANLTGGDSNSCFGTFAGSSITTANGNVIFGDGISPNSQPSQCVYIGSDAAASINATNISNTFIGFNAGVSATSATQCTLIGESSVIGNALTNSTAIGAGATVSTSNSLNLGNGCQIGINQASPGYALHISNTGSTANANVFIEDSTNPPTTPTGGGVFWISNGALVYMGSSGTTTIIAPA